MNNWDLYAPFYNASRKLERKAYEEMYKKIRKAIKDRYVLELATGTGIIAKNVAQSARHIDATDYSEKMWHRYFLIIRELRIMPAHIL